MKEIYILTGPVRSGKTTRLSKWCEKQDKVDGILAPVVNGVRHLHHCGSGKLRRLETEKTGDGTIRIGRFNFDQKVFEWAKERLDSIILTNPDWLIIDEIGPLELRGRGLEPAIKTILSERSFYDTLSMILVVREQLLDEVIRYYHLSGSALRIIQNVEFLENTSGVNDD